MNEKKKTFDDYFYYFIVTVIVIVATITIINMFSQLDALDFNESATMREKFRIKR